MAGEGAVNSSPQVHATDRATCFIQLYICDISCIFVMISFFGAPSCRLVAAVVGCGLWVGDWPLFAGCLRLARSAEASFIDSELWRERRCNRTGEWGLALM